MTGTPASPLSDIGRICYGISVAVLGILTLYYDAFPYMLTPFDPPWPGAAAYPFGALLVLTSAGIVLSWKRTLACAVLGCVLLLIFGLYLVASRHYGHFGDWENAAKALALAAGALIIAGWRPGIYLYSFAIVSFALDHFLYAHEAADYVPAWIPGHVACLYVTGAALMTAGAAILLSVRRRLAATLLGAMILTWFVILHVPRIVAAPHADLNGEIASAMLALAYGGTAWVIAAATPATASAGRRHTKGIKSAL